MIGVVAVIIFLAQMLNFPIASGTSGHLIGASFALLILGVDAAVIAMALVLLVQTLVFGDGGTLAIGANIFNMGIIGVYAADFAYKRINIERNMKIFVASLASVVAASAICALELAASGTSMLWPVLQSMTFTHVLIGLGEGLMTVALVGIFYSRLENITMRTALGTTGIAFLVLAVALPFASGSPDGLERVAIDLGFFGNAVEIYSAPFQDYSVSVLGTIPYLASLSAALAGSVLLFALPHLAVRPTSLPS
jgi:cobalt/nickel transport system permease protein